MSNVIVSRLIVTFITNHVTKYKLLTSYYNAQTDTILYHKNYNQHVYVLFRDLKFEKISFQPFRYLIFTEFTNELFSRLGGRVWKFTYCDTHFLGLGNYGTIELLYATTLYAGSSIFL